VPTERDEQVQYLVPAPQQRLPLSSHALLTGNDDVRVGFGRRKGGGRLCRQIGAHDRVTQLLPCLPQCPYPAIRLLGGRVENVDD